MWKIQGLFLSWMPVCVAGKRPWVGWLVGSVVEVAPTATFASATAGRYLEETKKRRKKINLRHTVVAPSFEEASCNSGVEEGTKKNVLLHLTVGPETSHETH